MFLRPSDRDLVLGWRAFLIAKFVRFSRFSKTENRGTDKQCKQLNTAFRTARQPLWGFNFYFDYNSRFLLDPYHRTDAGGAYPSGDSFIVYPGYPSPQGDVVDSVRLEVFEEAIADYRCLKLLEQKRGREFVRRLLGRNGYDGFSVYPTDGEAFLRFREEIVALTEESAENE